MAVNSFLKRHLREWCPPIVARLLRPVSTKPKTNGHVWFRGEYGCWKEAVAASTGYDSHLILQKVLNATLKVKHGEAAYERDSVVFDRIEYAWPVIAGLLRTAIQDGGRLRVLDFGGALGSSYFEFSRFTSGLVELRWGVVEQRHYVETGRQYIADGCLQFVSDIEECRQFFKPNCVLLSGVLQYIEDFSSLLEKLLALDANLIMIDRTIVNSGDRNKIYVQDVPPDIYLASYPVWSISEPRLIETLSAHRYSLVSDFPSLSFPGLAVIDSVFKGYLWRKGNAE